MQVILASQSPRRQELLKRLLSTFDIMPADIDESVQPHHTPETYVTEMAAAKAQAIADLHPDALVIACDTIVVHGSQIMGKPASEAAAFDLLRALSGTTHMVYTAIVLQKDSQLEQALIPAEVEFFDLTDDEIRKYLATGEYADKAGAYGIQGAAGIFVKKVTGDYYSIVGFPVGVVHQMLKRFDL